MTPTTSCSVLIPPGPRRWSRTYTILLASAVTALTGCGGSDPQFTADNVSSSMTEQIRSTFKSGTTMDPLECVKDGDQYHWKCIASVRQGSKLYQFSTNITCDGDTGKCLSEPEGTVPVG